MKTHYSLFLFLIIISFNSCSTFSQEKSIIGTFEYHIVNPEPSKIGIGELILAVDAEEFSASKKKRLDSIQNLLDNDIRYSKRYLKFTEKNYIDYRGGDGWEKDYNKKGSYIMVDNIPFYKIKSVTKDTILILDRTKNQEVFLIRTKDDLSRLKIFDARN